MGQRALEKEQVRRIDAPACNVETAPQVSTFQTDMGWFGLLGHGRAIVALTIGHCTNNEVRSAIRHRLGLDSADPDPVESDWNPELRSRLVRYARGENVDFTDCNIRLPQLTAFQKRVLDSTRKIPYGKTLSYAELADKAGSPQAARAVGNVMASNRVPILVPCHRVVASDGKLGGFSAPQGTDLKRRMLEMEAP